MLRTQAPGVSFWEAVLPEAVLPEAVLPEAVLRLPEELARVGAFLNDPVFFAPFVPFYDPGWADRPRRGRSTCG